MLAKKFAQYSAVAVRARHLSSGVCVTSLTPKHVVFQQFSALSNSVSKNKRYFATNKRAPNTMLPPIEQMDDFTVLQHEASLVEKKKTPLRAQALVPTSAPLRRPDLP